MTAELATLIGLSQHALETGFYLFLRIAPIVAFMPGFGETVVPARIKLVLALCFTAVMVPVVAPGLPIATHEAVFLQRLASETLIGLFLGLGLRLFIMALQTAGSMAAQATSLSQLFAGAAAEPMPAIGHMLVISGLALAMLMGLPVRIIALLEMSYRALPMGAPPDLSLFVEWAGALVARCFDLAFSLAAPFLVMSVLYNLTLGVINRAMPQLMVAFVGAPVITAGGLIFLLIFGPLMLMIWWGAFESFLFRPADFMR
ncbi:flagellar biosynthetic protein FliR [uncultured Lentibacter sp.]|uniref:flagellar biosynthetic protein FliR n=1 Tax=uncultured Lentibacter sp. TaxID=1659309 RepID=UPI00261F81D2|nr:flagellar biosynthetic protein FliR [uncultured Lentibacter sp.]